MMLGFRQMMRNHGFLLSSSGVYSHKFPHFTGISPCRRVLELGTAQKVGFRHRAKAGGWQQGDTAPAPAALGPTCPGSASSAAPHTRAAAGTLVLCLGDVSWPAAGRIGDAEHQQQLPAVPGAAFTSDS